MNSPIYLIRQLNCLFYPSQNIDLHALTGWIPERVAIRLDSPEFNKDRTFARIKERFHRGDVLVTVATGPLSEQEADRAGLVSTHAYAMLDVREFKVRKLHVSYIYSIIRRKKIVLPSPSTTNHKTCLLFFQSAVKPCRNLEAL